MLHWAFLFALDSCLFLNFFIPLCQIPNTKYITFC